MTLGLNVKPMETQKALRISFKTNPAVAEAAQGKSIGDEFNVEMKCKIQDIKPDEIVVGIDAVVPEGYEVLKEEDETMPPPPPSDPTATSATDEIPTALASMVKRKA